MDFKDKIFSLRERVIKNLNSTQTEEATKTAFILPLIQFLGYDIFDPSEVIPEYTADFGTKKGEKVDYALIINGNPSILIEAKHHNEKLSIHGSQLFRYFSVTKAKFAILTNGVEYEFYTDLDKPNLMDDRPFFKFNIVNIGQNEISEIKKFEKSNFNIEEIFSLASDLKYSSEILNIIQSELDNPSDDFIKFFTQKCYDGRITQKVLDQFKSIIFKSFKNYYNDLISKKLSISTDIIENSSTTAIESKNITEDSDKIITTFEEIETYSIIKSILSDIIDPKRIFYRDTQNYFNVILDDNRRKQICRVYLNGKKKYISFFDDLKEEKIQIESINDIFNFKEQILNSVKSYIETI